MHKMQLRLISDRKLKRIQFKNKKLHTFLQGYKQSTEIERGNVIENLKHVGNMSFLIRNINAFLTLK